MLSRLQELRKEEQTLLQVKAALHDQLNRLKMADIVFLMSVHRWELKKILKPRLRAIGKVEELALQSMISAREGKMTIPPDTEMEEHQNMDNEAAINQTKLQLQMHVSEEEEEEEEEESDS